MIHLFINGFISEGESVTDVHLRIYHMEMPETKSSKQKSLEEFEKEIMAHNVKFLKCKKK